MVYKPRKTDSGVVFMRVKPILRAYWPMYTDHLGEHEVRLDGKYFKTADDIYDFILQKKIDLVQEHLTGEQLKEEIKRIKRGFRKNYSRLLYTGIVWFSEVLEKRITALPGREVWRILYDSVDEIAKREGTITYGATIHTTETPRAHLHVYVLDESAEKVQGLHFHFSIIGYRIVRPFGDTILPLRTNPIVFRTWRNIFVEKIRKQGIEAYDSDALHLDPYGKIPSYMEEIEEEELKEKAVKLYLRIKKEKEEREKKEG